MCMPASGICVGNVVAHIYEYVNVNNGNGNVSTYFLLSYVPAFLFWNEALKRWDLGNEIANFSISRRIEAG